jgi:hypothetical protein
MSVKPWVRWLRYTAVGAALVALAFLLPALELWARVIWMFLTGRLPEMH